MPAKGPLCRKLLRGEGLTSQKWYERVTSAQHSLNTGPAHWWVSAGRERLPAPADDRNGVKDLRSGSRTSMDATDA
ncbi:hypothetical protein SAMN06272781_4779 [Streptomyces sp. 1222.2]|uniref:Uncharacterized protein n=1 Tax=Streptomyces stelliscabiei TaxID=146820 RepID=A0A8I0P9R4_9ACTN|nr:hypothetical protein [Streptomyces stelliscabiei]SOD76920.1 hypothetical protein SAMN06272781_4779 [Streptomyces sp. 1222.2]